MASRLDEEIRTRHKASRAILGKDSVVGNAGSRWHDELEILQRGSLRNLPMDSGGHQMLVILCDVQGHLAQVEDEIPDVPEELVLVDIPLLAISSWDINIRVDEADSLEVGRADDCRPSVGIADELGIIESKSRY